MSRSLKRKGMERGEDEAAVWAEVIGDEGLEGASPSAGEESTRTLI